MKEYIYRQTVKKGFLKKEVREFRLIIDTAMINGNGGISAYENTKIEVVKPFSYNLNKIIDLKSAVIDGHNGLIITIKEAERNTYILMLTNEPVEAIISEIEKAVDENRNLEKQIEQYKKFSQEQQANEYKNKLSDFKKIYDFHNLSTNPKYTFADDTMLYCGIYFSPDKSLNFIYIDGEKNIENIAVIPYDKIHYYDKSGNIHYTSTIDAEYHVTNSLKGSFTGGKSSVLAIMAGGLLFGTMGMIAGAAISHKPAENIISQENSNNISISSSIHKIDDRNVILNYYSDTIKQFADIELPYDIYNFLQTYLPEKKYEIVINLEKGKYQN